MLIDIAGRDFDAEMDQSDVSSSSGPPVNE